MRLFFSLWLKLFFVLTPFFGLTMFLTMTEGYDEHRRRRLALSVSVAVGVICLILFFVGRQLFLVFGITLDSFRIGAGALLLIAVVPLAVPIIVGPATTGTLLVTGAELNALSAKAAGSLALIFAVMSIAAVLLAGSAIRRLIGEKGISILTRLTGLILSALAAQMIMTGIQGFLGIAAH